MANQEQLKNLKQIQNDLPGNSDSIVVIFAFTTNTQKLCNSCSTRSVGGNFAILSEN